MFYTEPPQDTTVFKPEQAESDNNSIYPNGEIKELFINRMFDFSQNNLAVSSPLYFNSGVKTKAPYASTMRLDLMMQGDPSTKEASPPSASNTIPEAGRKRTEFDQLLDTLYDATILTDFEGNIVTANIRAHDFFQLEADAFPQCHITQLIDGANDDILNMVAQNIADSRYTLMQAYCIRADGSSFPAEISVTSVIRNTKRCLCFSVRDITVRREVEERLRIEGEAIRNAGDGIVITDTDAIITYTNPAVGRLWDCDPEEDLLGQPISVLFPQSEEIAEAVQTAQRGDSWNGELEGNKADDESIYLQTGITASRDDNEQITHLVFSFADITRRRHGEMALLKYQNHLEELIRERTANLEATNREMMREIEERRLAEEQLREAIHKLREHDKAKSVFVSNVSHELRTPLTSLINSLENLMRGVVGKVPPGVSSYFNMMLEDCWRLERTINDILDLTRMEKGTFKLERRRVPFARLLSRAAENMRISAEAIPLQYTIETHNCPGFVDCDVSKLERVLINVLSNAMKFTPPPGTCQVSFHQISTANALKLACDITDSGIGIPADCLSRVTERFFRIGEQVEGTGLGLAIAKETMEKHGGGIEITSPPPNMQKGTRVRLWLPKLAPMRVLFAAPEEEAPPAKELCEALREREYEISHVSKGLEAIQYLRDDHWDIALITPQLEDMSGTETIMHIMADRALCHVKLFYLAEPPLDQSKLGLLQRLEIPHLVFQKEAQRLIDTIEDAFLPASRVESNQYSDQPEDAG